MKNYQEILIRLDACQIQLTDKDAFTFILKKNSEYIKKHKQAIKLTIKSACVSFTDNSDSKGYRYLMIVKCFKYDFAFDVLVVWLFFFVAKNNNDNKHPTNQGTKMIINLLESCPLGVVLIR